MIPISLCPLSLEIFKGLNINFKSIFYRTVKVRTYNIRLHNIFVSTKKLYTQEISDSLIKKLFEVWRKMIANGLEQDQYTFIIYISRSSSSDVFLGKVALKICCKFTRKHPCRSVISIKLQRVKKSFQHVFSLVTFLMISIFLPIKL